jgi:CubicO group peptidase (beta-lactamase class C family)
MNKLGSKRCGLILVFLLFALSFSQLAAEPPENSRNATHSAMISEIIDEAEGLIKTGNLTGIAFGYITDEESEIICLGTTNSEKKQPVDRQTIFEMGSITKVFTVLLAHQQLAKDGLDLETPVSKLFQAETIAPDLFKNGVTCLNLALHNSGLPRRYSHPGNQTRDKVFVFESRIRTAGPSHGSISAEKFLFPSS